MAISTKNTKTAAKTVKSLVEIVESVLGVGYADSRSSWLVTIPAFQAFETGLGCRGVIATLKPQGRLNGCTMDNLDSSEPLNRPFGTMELVSSHATS